jgi:cytochrome c peroxidase
VGVLLLLAGVLGPLGLDRGLAAPPENPVTEEKVALGARLFFDRRLSSDSTIACADCHRPERGFADGKRVAEGVRGRRGTRNTPAIINRTYGRAFFWDGRAPALELQVLQPIQNPVEMAAELPELVARLDRDPAYASSFRAVFGRPPDATSLSHALASYVRMLLSGRSRYDRHEAGERDALDAAEREGLGLFRGRARCATCHSGSNFTDEDFHNTGISWNDGGGDPGRHGVTGRPEDRGKFKTPTLRDVELTAPYMHDGSFDTLEAVVEFYDRGAGRNPNLDPALRPIGLSAAERRSLVAFLKALTGDRPAVLR